MISKDEKCLFFKQILPTCVLLRYKKYLKVSEANMHAYDNLHRLYVGTSQCRVYDAVKENPRWRPFDRKIIDGF